MCVARFRYAYHKLRSWHVGPSSAAWGALRYLLTGDSGRFRSHGGWYKSRLRCARLADED